jgi:hypothetical protein
VLDVQLSAEYHWLDSDRDFTANGSLPNSNQYGKELDLVAGYSYKKNWSGKLEYFSFKEDELYGSATGVTAATRKRDTDKFMATVMYTF